MVVSEELSSTSTVTGLGDWRSVDMPEPAADSWCSRG